MCTSGCGWRTATSFSRLRSCASSTNWLFQNTLPSRSTAMTMFSGLVCVGRLRSRGRSTGTFCTTTGMVMRKMISSTSITSTSGVVLICEFRSSSSACPTCIAMSGHLVGRVPAAEERHLHAAAEAAHVLHGHAVAAHEPVVAEHCRHCDREAERRHDERLADGTGHLVDRRLPGDADRGERVVDAPDGAEEADQRSGRADRGEKREAGLQAVVDHVDRTVERHREPGIEVDLALRHGRMVLHRDRAFLGHEAKGAVLAQLRHAVGHGLGVPELRMCLTRVLHQPCLLDVLDDTDVPRADRHDDEDDERAAGDEVALLPERLDAVRVLDHLGAGRVVARRWRLRRHDDAGRRLVGARARGGRAALLGGLRECRTAERQEREGQHRADERSHLVHKAPFYSSLQTYSMRAHACTAAPLTVAGRNLHRPRPAFAASSRRRKPDERSILLSITLPLWSMRKLSSTVPVSFPRREADGYSGFSHEEASTTGGVRVGAAGAGGGGGAMTTGAGGGGVGAAVMVGGGCIGIWIFTSGGGMNGGGGAWSFGGGGGGFSGCGGLISSMILVSRGGATMLTILRASPWINA